MDIVSKEETCEIEIVWVEKCSQVSVANMRSLHYLACWVAKRLTLLTQAVNQWIAPKTYSGEVGSMAADVLANRNSTLTTATVKRVTHYESSEA